MGGSGGNAQVRHVSWSKIRVGHPLSPLTELRVALAILAGLTALLMPAFSVAQSRGRSSMRCTPKVGPEDKR